MDTCAESQGAEAGAADDVPPEVFCIMGPTAIGKTDLAVALAEQAGCEIVSVDSAMVYRRMDIGTGKPDAAVLARAPHRLIDIREPFETYSAAQFAEDAKAAVAEVLAGGRRPLLVGGTGLYFKALREGLATLPAAVPELRDAFAEKARADGWDALHERLRTVDPEAGRRIHPNDPQRIQRALEVFELTGKTMTELLARGRESRLHARFRNLIVLPRAREWLHDRIERRFDGMLKQGLLDEVAALRADSRIAADLPSMRAVGYRQAWAHLDGSLTCQEMRDRAIFATRQLAKRQLTWLRGQEDGTVLEVGPDGARGTGDWSGPVPAAVRGWLERSGHG